VRLGWVQFALLANGWSNDTQEALKRGFADAEEAIRLDPNLAEAYALKGSLTFAARRTAINDAIALLKKAVEMNPNSADSAAMLSAFLPYVGKKAEALDYSKQAMRLNPTPPDWYLHPVGRAHLYAGMCDEATDYLSRCTDKLPDLLACRRDLVVGLMALGRKSEAQAQVTEIIRIAPDFTLSGYSAETWAKVAGKKHDTDTLQGQCVLDDTRRFVLLYQAGIPE
jgi:adenylate cyclase